MIGLRLAGQLKSICSIGELDQARVAADIAALRGSGAGEERPFSANHRSNVNLSA